MNQSAHDDIRTAVRDNYTRIAVQDSGGCCGGGDSGCCTSDTPTQGISDRLGYSAVELESVPTGADLGLGCGTPLTLASAQPGETVLDLGSGAGLDAFLAAGAVVPGGRVIGVDMAPAMVSRARANATSGGYDNVEFRLGEIENLPVADASVDVIISNCVINLSPDKPAVFRDAFRVLRPGGRLALSDVVATAAIPAEVRDDIDLHSGCVAGASTIPDLEAMMAAAGFEGVRIAPKDESRAFLAEWAPGHNITEYLVSATIEATRPADAAAHCC